MNITPSDISRQFGITALTLLLSSCAFAPPATPNKAPAPSQYTAAPLAADSAADGIKQRFTLGQRAVPDWWKAYDNATLTSWVEEGLRNNHSLIATRHALDSAYLLFKGKAGGGQLPSLDLGTQASRQRALGLPNMGATTELYNVYSGQLSLSYKLDLFGATRHDLEQTAAQVDQQSYQLDAAKRTLAANIVITAITASAQAEQLALNQQLATLAHRQATLTEQAAQLGAAAPSDVLAQQQQAASLDANLPALHSQLQRTRHTLAVLLGRTPDQAPEPLALSQLHLPEDMPVSLPSDLLQQRPDIKAAEAMVHAASAQVGLATANMFPQITLSATTGTGAYKAANLFTGAGAIWSTGLSITQPLFHGGELRAQRDAAKASYLAAQEQYQQTVLNAFQNVADTLTALTQDAQALEAASSATKAAQASHAIAQSRYQLGAIAYPTLLASEQQWRNALLGEIQARAARLTDSAALFQAMGIPLQDKPVTEKTAQIDKL